MRSLVTGVSGFIGSQLAQTLSTLGDHVYGFSRKSNRELGPGIQTYQIDMSDRDQINAIVRKSQPDRVFHLAALNNIVDSFSNPLLTMDVNVNGTLHLLEALRYYAPDATVISVGSSAEYGHTAAQHETLDEDLPLLPSSPYGASKAAQGMLVRLYANAFKLRAIHVRPFAVIGPGKSGDALSDFCRGVALVEAGTTSTLDTGDLSSIRDFVDLRDCLTALILLSSNGEPGGVYNVCNGLGKSLRDIVEILRAMSLRPFQVVEQNTHSRPADDLRVVGNNERLRAVGYRQRYSLIETVESTLAHWRRGS